MTRPRPWTKRARDRDEDPEGSHRRYDIAEAALHVARAHGLAMTSVRAVASAAGRSKAALGYYFKDRDDLLMELCSVLATRAPPAHDIDRRVAELRADPAAADVRLELLVAALRDDELRRWVNALLAGPTGVHPVKARFAAAALDGIALHARLDAGFDVEAAVALLRAALRDAPQDPAVGN